MLIQNNVFDILKISGQTYSSITIKGEEIKELKLRQINNQQIFPVYLSFNKVNIKKLEAIGVKFMKTLTFNDCHFTGLVNFNNSEFCSPVYFTASKNSTSSFSFEPQFFGSRLHHLTVFHNNIKFNITDNPSGWRIWENLKHHMQEFNADHYVQKFHALELEARLKTELPKIRNFTSPLWLESVCSAFLKAVTKYGTDMRLPILWLLFLLS